MGTSTFPFWRVSGVRLAAFCLPALMLSAPVAHAADAEPVLNARCAACHERLPEGGLLRISEAQAMTTVTLEAISTNVLTVASGTFSLSAPWGQ